MRQRPTHGREGNLDGAGWQEEPKVFVHDPALTPVGEEQPARPATITLTPRQPRRGSSAEPQDAQTATLLLVRMTRGRWGSNLTADLPESTPLTLHMDDAADVGVEGELPATILEWRCLAQSGGFHDWACYPTLAQSAVDWISRTALTQPGPVLLGMLVPQEVAVGMGVLIGAMNQDRWPLHLWPVHFEAGGPSPRLVIPRLDLGWAGVRPVGRG